MMRVVVVNARVVRKGFRGKVRRKDMCCDLTVEEALDRVVVADVAIAMSAIECSEGSFGRSIVRPMD
jgi:hypothetical protein